MKGSPTEAAEKFNRSGSHSSTDYYPYDSDYCFVPVIHDDKTISTDETARNVKFADAR